MICPKCQSENVNTQIVNTVVLKDKHRGIIWWLLIGWWWVPIKWIFFTLPALLLVYAKGLMEGQKKNKK